MTRILAIDAGTTGVRGIVVDGHGELLGGAYRELPQSFPRPGWVEHDPEAIWRATVAACDDALTASSTTGRDVTCIGIANQRETTIVWERRTLAPIHPAIVWQDRRTADACDRLRRDGHEALIRDATGLVVDAYFSATKVAWLLDEVDGARRRADQGDLAFGTVDTWLVARLTGGRVHVTEPSNASRTMLWDLGREDWSGPLLDLLHVPAAVLPEVRDSSGHLADVEPAAFLGISAPVTGVAGDQQAALFGQGCWRPGMSKNTYGTGSFLLLNTGTDAPRSSQGLLTSAGWRLDGHTTHVLEGAIFATGASVQWLRDSLGIIDAASDVEALARQRPDGNDGVYLVPAFAGLGAPHWDPYARAAIVGLTRGSGRAHLARAAVEAMAYQSAEVAAVMAAESGRPLAELRVDGGAAVNDLLCQFQADVLGVPVVRPAVAETTAMGAAFLAGLGAGVWTSTDELADVWRLDTRFEPAMRVEERERLLAGWREAVARATGWARAVPRSPDQPSARPANRPSLPL